MNLETQAGVEAELFRLNEEAIEMATCKPGEPNAERTMLLPTRTYHELFVLVREISGKWHNALNELALLRKQAKENASMVRTGKLIWDVMHTYLSPNEEELSESDGPLDRSIDAWMRMRAERDEAAADFVRAKAEIERLDEQLRDALETIRKLEDK